MLGKTTNWSTKMARKKSVILTASDKRALAKELKESLKHAKSRLREANKALKLKASEYAKATKELDRARKLQDSEYAKATKAIDKDIKDIQKNIANLEADLLVVLPTKAVPSPTDP